MTPRRSTIFNAVEFGALAYGVYCSISAFIGGILFLIIGSVISSQVNSFNNQAGPQAQAPDVSGAVVAIGIVLVIAGAIGFVACVGLIAKRRAEGQYDDLGIGRPGSSGRPGGQRPRASDGVADASTPPEPPT